MKLARIELENFRIHTNSVLDLKDVIFGVVKGPVFAGKSSIGQAVSMGLTPSTMGLDAQGRGFESKIKQGESKSVITLQMQAKHLIERKVILNTNTSGRTNESKCLDDPSWKPLPFEKFLTRYKDALMVVCNTDYFTDHLDKDGQKNLLAKLVLPDHYEFPADTIKAVEEQLGEGAIKFDGEPFDVIAKAYKKLFDERTVVNRQVKEFHIPDLLPIDVKVDSVGLEKALEEYRGERRRLQAERDTAVDAVAEIEKKRSVLLSKIDTLTTEVQDKKKNLEALGKELLSSSKLGELQKIYSSEPEYTKLQNELVEVKACIQQKGVEIKRLEEIPDLGSKCPTCEQVVDAEKIKELLDELLASKAKYESRTEEILQRLKALGDVTGAGKQIEDHNKKASEKAALDRDIMTKVDEGKKTRRELNALGEYVDPREAFVQPLTDLEAKITAAQEQLRPVIAAEERKAEVAKKTEALEGLKKNAEVLDGLVKYFDTGAEGIKSKLIAEHIGGFENKFNEVLSSFGYKVALSLEPYEFSVTTSRGTTLPLKELSGAEKLMFLLGLQCAVSRVAEIGFMIADRMDTFPMSQRKKANRCLIEMLETNVLEQVLMIVADENKEVPPNVMNGMAFFYVTDGSVARL